MNISDLLSCMTVLLGVVSGGIILFTVILLKTNFILKQILNDIEKVKKLLEETR